MKLGDVLKVLGAWAVVVAFAVLLVGAGSYNQSQIDQCKDQGLVWVKEYPFGDYGCAKMETK